MNRWQIHLAVKKIKAGGVIAYPTESVFGLGCDASNLQAVSHILQIKKRPYTKGLIVLVSDICQASHLIKPMTAKEQQKVNQESNRATTWLIEKQSHVSPLISGLHEKLAIRVTSNPTARTLCQLFGMPIISTSCNLNKKPTSNSVSTIRNKVIDQVSVLSGKCCEQQPSQIIDLESGLILRK